MIRIHASVLFVMVAALGLVVAFANSAPAQATPTSERGEPADFTDIIVNFFDDPDDLELDDLEGLGGTIKYVYHVIPAIAATVPISALQQLEEDARIERVEPDLMVFTDPAPDDPEYSNQWASKNDGQTGGTPDADIDALEAWAVTTGSASVVIAVVDSGVQVAPGFSGSVSSHPDLAANLWVNPDEIPGDGVDNDGNGYVDDIHGWNFYDDASWLFYSASEDGHGTHVAGTIAADANNNTGVAGINWQAQVMVLKFIGPSGGFTSDAIAAIEYATDKGARVINASWGGLGFSLALKSAIEACNCLFVAAVISVAATEHNDQLASFSNYGLTSVDLGAPGLSILSTLPFDSYGSLSGTSMATPHVSGVAGLVYSQTTSLTPVQAKARILSGVDPIPSLSGITVTGGRLNAANALASVPPLPPPKSPPPSTSISEPSLSQPISVGGTTSFLGGDSGSSHGLILVLGVAITAILAIFGGVSWYAKRLPEVDGFSAPRLNPRGIGRPGVY